MTDSADRGAQQTPVAFASPHGQKTLAVHHWTERLFSFTLTRPPWFRFRAGEFVMLGLRDGDGRPLRRAYSIASPVWDDVLEFYSIKVPDGPFTSLLQKIQPGDVVMLGQKTTGTLVVDGLRPGQRLFLLATGTGVAPFASVIRDLETYDKFDQVFLTHTCRLNVELTYSRALVEQTLTHSILGETAGGALHYFDSVTREPFLRRGRITTFIKSGELFEHLGVEPFDATTDRVMVCGSTEMTQDIKAIMHSAGFTEGAVNRPGEFVVEKAFVG